MLIYGELSLLCRGCVETKKDQRERPLQGNPLVRYWQDLFGFANAIRVDGQRYKQDVAGSVAVAWNRRSNRVKQRCRAIVFAFRTGVRWRRPRVARSAWERRGCVPRSVCAWLSVPARKRRARLAVNCDRVQCAAAPGMRYGIRSASLRGPCGLSGRWRASVVSA